MSNQRQSLYEILFQRQVIGPAVEKLAKSPIEYSALITAAAGKFAAVACAGKDQAGVTVVTELREAAVEVGAIALMALESIQLPLPDSRGKWLYPGDTKNANQ